MIKFNARVDIAQARRSLDLIKTEVDKAAARALERVGVTTRKEASDAIRQRLAIKAGTAKEQIKVTRPYGSKRLVRDIVASGKPIAIRDYGARRTKRGVTFKVTKGSKRKIYVAKGNKGFISDRFGGHVFARTEADPPGPRKGRIRKVFGPSLPQYFVTRFVRERMERVAATRWPIEFAREINFRRQRAAGAG